MARSVPGKRPGPTPPPQAIRERFDQAVADFVERARKDPYILGVVLFGSLSYDTVWAKSDVDLVLITTEAKGAKSAGEKYFTLVEQGLPIHASLATRSSFRRMIEGSLRSSFMHSALARGKLLFSRDQAISELFENIQHLGEHDRQVQLLRSATNVLPALTKAEKWLKVRNDLDYCGLWLLYCVGSLAQVEVYLDNQVAGRDVIQQAMAINPRFFKAVYTDVLNRRKVRADLEKRLAMIEAYLLRKLRTLFGPVLEYLQRAGSPRSASEIDSYFRDNMDMSLAVLTCEWLAEKGIITSLSQPVRLTEKSQVEFEEMAFYYAG
jgi:predicted nucleotidyltransferase